MSFRYLKSNQSLYSTSKAKVHWKTVRRRNIDIPWSSSNNIILQGLTCGKSYVYWNTYLIVFFFFFSTDVYIFTMCSVIIFQGPVGEGGIIIWAKISLKIRVHTELYVVVSGENEFGLVLPRDKITFKKLKRDWSWSRLQC